MLDHLPHELDAEAAAAVLVEHVDVGEVDEAGRVAVDRAAEADLAAVVVEADDARARVDQLVLPLARRPFAQYDSPAEVGVHGVAVDPRRGRRRARSRRRDRASRGERTQPEAAVLLVRRGDRRAARRAWRARESCSAAASASGVASSGSIPPTPSGLSASASAASRTHGRPRRRRAARSRRASRRPRRTRRSSSGAAGSRRARAA